MEREFGQNSFICRMIIEEKHPLIERSAWRSKLLLAVCNNRTIRISYKLNFQWSTAVYMAGRYSDRFHQISCRAREIGGGGGVGCHESRIHATIPCSDRSAQIILWTSVYSNAESIRMRNGTITTNAYPRMGLFRKEVVIGYLYLLVRSL